MEGQFPSFFLVIACWVTCHLIHPNINFFLSSEVINNQIDCKLSNTNSIETNYDENVSEDPEIPDGFVQDGQI